MKLIRIGYSGIHINPNHIVCLESLKDNAVEQKTQITLVNNQTYCVDMSVKDFVDIVNGIPKPETTSPYNCNNCGHEHCRYCSQ